MQTKGEYIIIKSVLGDELWIHTKTGEVCARRKGVQATGLDLVHIGVLLTKYAKKRSVKAFFRRYAVKWQQNRFKQLGLWGRG